MKDLINLFIVILIGMTVMIGFLWLVTTMMNLLNNLLQFNWMLM